MRAMALEEKEVVEGQISLGKREELSGDVSVIGEGPAAACASSIQSVGGHKGVELPGFPKSRCLESGFNIGGMHK